jgi:D-glycero-D-manno-heptose 1,7-bisphosphate phosphatase
VTFVWRTGRAMSRQLREVRAVLFEVNDTLVRTSGQHGGRSSRLAPAPLAVQALSAVRRAGLPVGAVSAPRQVAAPTHTGAGPESLKAQVGEILGPFDTWRSCGHTPQDGCSCRAPGPHLVLEAAQDLGVPSHNVAVISDIGPDMKAAQAAGAVGILVPSARTLRAELDEVPLVAPDLISAVEAVLGLDRSWVPES